jgi:hypothetical protein
MGLLLGPTDALPPPVHCEVFGGIATPPEVFVNWPDPDPEEDVLAFRIRRDGEVIAELPPDATQYVEEPLGGSHEYEVWLVESQDSERLVGGCIVDWEPPRIGGFLRGDANADGGRDLTDAVFILLYLFDSGAQPSCLRSADCDDNGAVDVTDAVYLLSFLFQGAPPPPEPHLECDYDRTPDGLSCEAFAPCFHPPPP